MGDKQYSKLTEIYPFRIPKQLKDLLDGLSDAQKVIINRALRVELARQIHISKFSSEDYLCDTDEDEESEG